MPDFGTERTDFGTHLWHVSGCGIIHSLRPPDDLDDLASRSLFVCRALRVSERARLRRLRFETFEMENACRTLVGARSHVVFV